MKKISEWESGHGTNLDRERGRLGAWEKSLSQKTIRRGDLASQHKPFEEGLCSGCHDPHASANPKFFLRGSGNDLCFICHDEFEMEEHRHPVGTVPMNTFPRIKLMEEGETTCSSCHSPHATDSEYLLPEKGCGLPFLLTISDSIFAIIRGQAAKSSTIAIVKLHGKSNL